MGRTVVLTFPAPSPTSIAPLQTVNAAMSGGAAPLYLNPYIPVNSNTIKYVPTILTRGGAATQISFTSSGNSLTSQINISGLDANGKPISETLAGPNSNTITSVKAYQTINTLFTNNTTPGTKIFVNLNTTNLPTFIFKGYQTQLLATVGVIQTAGYLTIIGTDLLGNVFLETVVLSAEGTFNTVNQFATIIMASIGGLAGPLSLGTGNYPGILSPIKMDIERSMLMQYTLEVIVTGTLTYEINQTIDTLESTVAGQGQVINQNVNWLPLIASTSSNTLSNQTICTSSLQCVVTASGGGSLVMKVIQQGLI